MYKSKMLVAIMTFVLCNCSLETGGGIDGIRGQPNTSDRGNDGFGSNNRSNNNQNDSGNTGGTGSKKYVPRSPGNQGESVEFVIQSGTGSGTWNSETTAVELSLGDVLVIKNDDIIDHQLHTNGKPCDHGTVIRPGESYECLIDREYSYEIDGVLYDHIAGENAKFWIIVNAEDERDAGGDVGDSDPIEYSAVAPIIEAKCGGQACHGESSRLAAYAVSEGLVNENSLTILDRIERSSGGEMPPVNSGRTLAGEDYELFVGYLQQKINN